MSNFVDLEFPENLDQVDQVKNLISKSLESSECNIEAFVECDQLNN